MSFRGVSQVIFSLHLGAGHSVLLQLEGVGHVFYNHHISKCSGPPPPLHFLTSPLTLSALNYGSSGPGSSLGRGLLCSWERYFTPTVPLSSTTAGVQLRTTVC